MSNVTQKTEILDFNKLEDLFFCIDVLTRASSSLRRSETELAADVDRIINSLTAFSQDPTKKPCDKYRSMV